MAFEAFDLLQLDSHDVMGEPWADRRKRLEDLGAAVTIANVTIVPVTDDAARLWTTWVGWGGEGIVLKDRRPLYRPGLSLRLAKSSIDRRSSCASRQATWNSCAGGLGWAARLTLT